MINCPGFYSCKLIPTLAATLAIFTPSGLAQTDPIASQIGSINTVTADPPVPRPAMRPCVVPLFTTIQFADFSPKAFSYTPPACPGPWAKVVLEANFSVTAGRQFDRTATIWIGGTNIYFGTTSEPSRTTSRECLPAASNFSRCWHVERDLTEYSPLFAVPQAGRVDLGNLVNATFTGVLFGSAALQFYSLEESSEERTADVVLPLSASPTGGTVALQTGTSALARTFRMPMNIERAYLDVIAQSQANDEFWYTCVPDQDAANLQSCGGTAFRETEVSIDGQPAAVAPVYPWIYTGGIDPFLWRPIPGVQTLNFVPYRVDLTPFAGVLSDGLAHTVAVSVFNANHNFATTATLLLYLDHESSQVTGRVTQNTLAANPTLTIVGNLSPPAADGTITGTVTTTSSRQFTVAGEVRTSHGLVRTQVTQSIDFSNAQQFVSNPKSGSLAQNITQNTSISSLTQTSLGEEHTLSFIGQQWPLTVNFSFVPNPDGSFTQATDIDQEFHRDDVVKRNGDAVFISTVSNVVKPSDTLFFSPSFAITGNTGQSGSQQYFSKDSNGACFSRSVTAASGRLTSITDGEGCEQQGEGQR